jgi:hypothetical protein
MPMGYPIWPIILFAFPTNAKDVTYMQPLTEECAGVYSKAVYGNVEGKSVQVLNASFGASQSTQNHIRNKPRPSLHKQTQA